MDLSSLYLDHKSTTLKIKVFVLFRTMASYRFVYKKKGSISVKKLSKLTSTVEEKGGVYGFQNITLVK
jgi:hypothetical protein